MILLDHIGWSRLRNIPCSFPPLVEGEACPICDYDPQRERDRADKIDSDIRNGYGGE